MKSLKIKAISFIDSDAFICAWAVTDGGRCVRRFRALDSDSIVEGVEQTLRFALRLTLVNTDEGAEPTAEEARKLDGVEGDIDEGSLKVADGPGVWRRTDVADWPS